MPGVEPFFALPFRPAERQMATERTFYVLDYGDAVLRSLKRFLSSANFEPVTFDRPDAFLAAARTFKTGCVLLDVRLPGMSGLDVQTQLFQMRSDRPGRCSNRCSRDEGGRKRLPGKTIQRSCAARIDRGGVQQRNPLRSRPRNRRRRPADRNPQSTRAGSS